MKIALVHYAYTPVIGGGEFVMEQHAALFARHGYEVKVVCGSGASGQPDVEVVVIPELSAGSDACAASQEVLRQPGGEALPAFCGLKDTLREKIGLELEGCDIVFVHNILTMHFNLAATVALWEIAEARLGVRFVSWVHDLSAVNPDYRFSDPDAFPWELMRCASPHFEPVAISVKRQKEFARLTGVSARACTVVPNGVEFLRLLKLTENMQGLVRSRGLLYQDLVLVHPARILRRKNIEFGVRVLAEIKKLGVRCTYLVTGAPDPHNEASREYGRELKSLIVELGVEDVFVFVSELFPVEDDDLAGLYSVGDALFLPSRQEGFGLPVLESALFRIPVFCPGIEPMKSILKHNVFFFELDAEPGDVAVQVMEALAASKGFLSRKEVMRKYSWDKLFEQIIGPTFLDRGVADAVPPTLT